MSLLSSLDTNEDILNYLAASNDRTQQEVANAAELYNGHDFKLIERLAYWSYKGYKINFEVTKQDLDEAVQHVKQLESNPKISKAGYAALNATGNGGTEVDSKTPFWLLWLLITRDLQSYWSSILPATLNMIDSEDVSVKIQGAKLAQLIAELGRPKLQQTGLIPVFQSALKLLLYYLPPSTDVNESIAINSATQSAMLELASTRPEYNFLMIQVFAALEHARGHVEFTLSLLKSITNLVFKMKLLTVAHLGQLVEVFNAVACDPFADMSADLLEGASTMMTTVMQQCSPRIEVYKYSIALGVEKAELWDKPVGKELEKYLSRSEVNVK